MFVYVTPRLLYKSQSRIILILRGAITFTYTHNNKKKV